MGLVSLNATNPQRNARVRFVVQVVDSERDPATEQMAGCGCPRDAGGNSDYPAAIADIEIRELEFRDLLCDVTRRQHAVIAVIASYAPRPSEIAKAQGVSFEYQVSFGVRRPLRGIAERLSLAFKAFQSISLSSDSARYP